MAGGFKALSEMQTDFAATVGAQHGLGARYQGQQGQA